MSHLYYQWYCRTSQVRQNHQHHPHQGSTAGHICCPRQSSTWVSSSPCWSFRSRPDEGSAHHPVPTQGQAIYCSKLEDYRYRIGASTFSTCPDCGVADHTVAHLFSCPSHPTPYSAQPLDYARWRHSPPNAVDPPRPPDGVHLPLSQFETSTWLITATKCLRWQTKCTLQQDCSLTYLRNRMLLAII